MQAREQPDTAFVDAADLLFDATIPYDATFFEALDRRVQAEPWLTRDRAMIDTLKAIGIEKGRPFAPDTATTTALTDAMQEAHAWLDARYEEVFNATFYDDARWALPAPPELVEATTTGFSNSDSYPVDDRGVLYSWAFFSAKQLGTGQFYLMTIKDKNGDASTGRRPTDSPCPRTFRSRCTGRPPPTTAPPTPSSETRPGPAGPRTPPVLRPMTTDQ